MLNTKLHLNKEVFTTKDVISMRQGFGDEISKIAKINKDVYALTADLATSMKLDQLMEESPKQFIQMGVAEQNMAGVAAGMALSGKIPVITSYALWNPGRNWEQVRLSICLTNANVKILGSHAGLSHSFDGGSAQCLEDIALSRVLPRIVVLSPCDYWQTRKSLEWAIKHKGPVYLRIARSDIPEITTEETPFNYEEAQKLVEGKDISIFATGDMVIEALRAAKDLKAKYKVSAEVINVHTIKPLDSKTLVASAKKTKNVITLEDHQITGGLGGAVCELLSKELPTKVTVIGIQDKFGESGKYDELKDKYGLSAHHVVNKAIKLLGQKEE